MVAYDVPVHEVHHTNLCAHLLDSQESVLLDLSGHAARNVLRSLPARLLFDQVLTYHKPLGSLSALGSDGHRAHVHLQKPDGASPA